MHLPRQTRFLCFQSICFKLWLVEVSKLVIYLHMQGVVVYILHCITAQ
jgi:hypothetical protein